MAQNSTSSPASPRRATLRTVAEACGLAVTTVSRALNNHDDIALETRERVRRVADGLGYVPNRAGRGLRTGRTHVVSLVVPSHSAIAGYTSSIIFSLGQVCREHGYELAAMPVYSEQDELDTLRSIVTHRRSDGVILSRIAPQDLRVRYLLEAGFPFVTHGRTELASKHAWVDFDNQAFSELASTRLIERGCRSLMLIPPPADLTYATHTALGFQRTVTRLNARVVPAPAGLSIETPPDELKAVLTSLLQAGEVPDGVVCGGELAALAVLGAVRDAGLIPNRDVLVAAKQTSVALDHVDPPIDSCIERLDEAGRLLGEAVLQVIDDKAAAPEPQWIVAPDVCWRSDDRARVNQFSHQPEYQHDL